MSDDTPVVKETGQPEPPKPEADPEVIDGIPEFPPEIPKEVIDKLPSNVKQSLLAFFHSQRIGFPVNPIIEKLTPEHIDKTLQSAENDAERDHKEYKWDKISGGLYALLFVALFVFLVIFLIDRKPDMIRELIQYAAVFAGGFGLKSYLDRKSE